MNTVTKIKTEQTNLREQIRELRDKINELQLQRDQVENAFLPVSEAIAKMQLWVHEQANRFDTSILLPFLHPTRTEISIGEIDAKTKMVEADGQLLAMSAHADLSPLLCFLFKDQIEITLESKLKEMGYNVGLPTDKRPARLEKLDNQIYELEIQEEELIVQAKNCGIQITRHPNFNPEIVLQFKE